jgi:CRISPR-associated protein Cas1
VKEDFYINKHGKLIRKENTVYFVDMEGNKHLLPVNKISALYVYGHVTMTSGVIFYFAQMGIPVHFFNKYGFYTSSFYPREKYVSGLVAVKQAEHYLNNDKRMKIAQKFIDGAAGNILRNLSRWKLERGKIDELRSRIPATKNVRELMEVEGKIREEYYRIIDNSLPDEYKMVRRVRQPPNNKMNSLISFGNSLMYTTVLSEIYNTQLYPEISFLHEPSERRFSLALDIAEIFKPSVVDRIIMKLIHKNMLDYSDFRNDLNAVLLSDAGRRKFLKEYNSKLKTTVQHRGLGKKVSIKRLIRIECYKLIKHLINAEEYHPLIAWW